MRNPRSTVLPKPPARPSPEPLPEEPDEFTVAGEWLRKAALGLTAALLTARAYFPSEPDLKAEAGSGLAWSMMVLVAAGLALLSPIVGGRLRLRWSWTDAAVIALTALVGFSTYVALDRRTAINLGWQWGAVGFAYLLVRNLPRTRGESTALAGALVATAVAVAFYGLYQVGVELGEVRAAYLKDPQGSLRLLGIAPGSPAQALLEYRVLGSNEPWSTFALTNSLAGYLVGPLVLLLAVAWQNLRTAEGRGARGVALGLAALPALVLLVCLTLTKSRSAYVGLAVALLVLAWRERRQVRPRTLLITAVAALVVLGVLIGAGLATGGLDRLVLTDSTKSMQYRWQYWQGAWRVITLLPGTFWRGVGPGNFGWAYVLYKLPEASEEVVDPHDMLLEVWATAGVLAALALVAALGLALWNLLGPPGRERSLSGNGESDASLPSPKPAAPCARPFWLVVCSGGGWLLVALMGDLNPFQADLFSRWLILGGAWLGAVMFGLPLWRRLPIAASGLGLGALAVMVSLLAAGGIGIPAVSLMLWTLIALGLNLREDRPCGRLRDAGGRMAAFGLAVVWAALTGVFFGAVLPFWHSERAIAEAEEFLAKPQPDYAKARDAYLRAADEKQGGDKFSARPWLGLAYLEYRAWKDSGGLPENKSWRRVPISLYKAVDKPRNPNAWALHRERALVMRDLLSQIGSRLPPLELITFRGNVVEAARNATRLYPTNASLHALLAESSADMNLYPDAVAEAEEALRLDRLTPHADKKLPRSVRKRLEDQLPVWRTSAQGMKSLPR
jgi:hypothetical protein